MNKERGENFRTPLKSKASNRSMVTSSKKKNSRAQSQDQFSSEHLHSPSSEKKNY